MWLCSAGQCHAPECDCVVCNLEQCYVTGSGYVTQDNALQLNVVV